MAVGRDKAQLAAVHDHEQAVQVVADILLRHRVVHQTELAAQHLLRQREARRFAARARQARKVFRRQRLQAEAAAAGLDQQALVLRLQVHVDVLGQRPQDVEQLSRTHGERLGVAPAADAAFRGDLDL